MPLEYFVSARLAPGGQLTRGQHKSHSSQPNLGSAPTSIFEVELFHSTQISVKNTAKLPQALPAAQCALPSRWPSYSQCILAGKCVLMALGSLHFHPMLLCICLKFYKQLPFISLGLL